MVEAKEKKESMNLMLSVAATLPAQGTALSVQWDYLYNFLIWLSIFFTVLILGGMFWFAYKYRKSKGAQAEYITGNHKLEILFISVPTVLLMVIFAWGWFVYEDMIVAPPNSYEVRVIGRKWSWQFQYDNGRSTYNELIVPVHQPVKLLMISEDVIHSFFVPNFRIKQDVIPARYTTVWFEATLPGSHQIYCAEYCGDSHSLMLGNVIALEEADWKKWLATGDVPENVPRADGRKVQVVQTSSTTVTIKKTIDPVAYGKKLMRIKTCVSCHSADGSKLAGPTFKGLYGSKVKLVTGKMVVADDNYLRNSMLRPMKDLVKGYAPSMPVMPLKEKQVSALIDYIKSLK